MIGGCPAQRSFQLRCSVSRRSAWIVALAILAGGCFRSSPPAATATPQKSSASPLPTQAGAPTAAAASRPAEQPASPAPSPAAKTVPATDEVIRKPATVEEAARVIDLRTFPRLDGALEDGTRAVAEQSYEAPAQVKPSFEFIRNKLLAASWIEQSHSYVTDESASASFVREGFHVSLSVFSGAKPSLVQVHLKNHGNLNLAKLPVPPGANLQHAFPAVASFITSAGRKETASATKKLLLDQGWKPYGAAGDTMMFKQNAVKLSATVMSPPAMPGKTVIDFSSEQLSADIPAPADAEEVQYADGLNQLNLASEGEPEKLADFYRQELAPAGWKPTTDNIVKDRLESFMIFRNPAGDLISLNMRDLKGKTRATVRYQTAEQVAEEKRRMEAKIAAREKEKAAQNAAPTPAVDVLLPQEADDVEATPSEIKFQLPTGKAEAAVSALVKNLERAGWEAQPRDGQREAGRWALTKDDHEIAILYVDPGLVPAEITIEASGIQLKRALPTP